MNYRSWERWDDPGTADLIDAYWRRTPQQKEYRQRLATLTAVHLRPGANFLEVGCASGYLYEHMMGVAPTMDYTGVDVSERMVAIAKASYPGVRFLKGDAFALEFPDGSFDVVGCFDVLGHLPEMSGPLRELLRVASRTVVFTAWIGPEMKDLGATINGSKFLHRIVTHADVMAALGPGVAGRTECSPVSGVAHAYIVRK